MRKMIPILLVSLCGCFPREFTLHIPALENKVTVPDPGDSVPPKDESGWLTPAEWTTVITGFATALGIIIHRMWFHKKNGNHK